MAIAQSNNKARALVINVVLCLVSPEQLTEYGTAEKFVSSFNLAVRKAVLYFVAETTKTNISKKIFNDVINKYIQHQNKEFNPNFTEAKKKKRKNDEVECSIDSATSHHLKPAELHQPSAGSQHQLHLEYARSIWPLSICKLQCNNRHIII
ncbi:hypothetical protein PV325_002482 [Microctonus aethiopoides]|nr:hypothetical protein PV325_002482 [Microctonus aethiopoides]